MLKFFATNRSIDRLGRAIRKNRSAEASTWFRILTDTMKNIPGVGGRVVTSPADLAAKRDADDGTLTAFVGFSWPSNGRVLSYLSDQTAAVDSKTAFASLLARLKTTGKTVDLIGHSMGNYLICHTLAALGHSDHIDARTVVERIAAELEV